MARRYTGSYDHALTLISKKTNGTDGSGNPVKKELRNDVLCKKSSETRAEFYLGAQAKLKPSIVFIVHSYEYEGQKEVEFEGARYSVIRAPELSFEETEIVCERKIANAQGLG